MYPTSDLQHVAQMLLLTRAGGQIKANDAHRLEEIAKTGVSSQPVEGSGAPILNAPPTRGGQV